jgi:septum formation protein
LHLASSSPRRREILASLGLPFTWDASNVDEMPLAGEAADGMVLRLAAAKARAAGVRASTVVLAADTAVVLGSRILGKPSSAEEAMDMLGSLSGRTHQVLTGVALATKGELRTALSTSDVRFREITSSELRAYGRSGEFAGKAGAYAIQGLAGLFVASLRGSYTGVVGLPVFETAALLRDAGMDILQMTTIAGPTT